MKYSAIIILLFSISLGIYAAEIKTTDEAGKLNQRLELIAKVNSLTAKLNDLKADHLSKMNTYAELIEQKEALIKNQKTEFADRLKVLRDQNLKDRNSFNAELDKQRKLMVDAEDKYSENIDNINSGYFDEISELKEKYESLLKDKAEEYQENLADLQESYDTDMNSLKGEFEEENNNLTSKLAAFQESENFQIAELQKRLSTLEKSNENSLAKKEDEKINAASVLTPENPQVDQEEHTYFYKLIHRII